MGEQGKVMRIRGTRPRVKDGRKRVDFWHFVGMELELKTEVLEVETLRVGCDDRNRRDFRHVVARLGIAAQPLETGRNQGFFGLVLQMDLNPIYCDIDGGKGYYLSHFQIEGTIRWTHLLKLFSQQLLPFVVVREEDQFGHEKKRMRGGKEMKE